MSFWQRIDIIIDICRTAKKVCAVATWRKKPTLLFALLCLIALIYTIGTATVVESSLEVCKGQECQINSRIKIRLIDVETIEGVGWVAFTKNYYNNKIVLGKMYASTSIKRAAAKAEEHIELMNEAKWEKFLADLNDPDKVEGLKSFAFAHFCIKIDNKEDAHYQNRIYCKGDVIKFPEDGSIESSELAHVYYVEQPLSGGDVSTIYFERRKNIFVKLIKAFLEKE